MPIPWFVEPHPAESADSLLFDQHVLAFSFFGYSYSGLTNLGSGIILDEYPQVRKPLVVSYWTLS